MRCCFQRNDLNSTTQQNPAHEVKDAQPQRVRQSLRTRKPPVRFGLDEYVDVATIEHLACTAGQVFKPHTIEEGNVKVEYCPTEVMIADLLTKLTSKECFERLRQMMGLINLII